jgi:hypothetical protein
MGIFKPCDGSTLRASTERATDIGMVATVTITAATGMPGHGGPSLSPLESVCIYRFMAPDIAIGVRAMASIIAGIGISDGGGRRKKGNAENHH